MSSHLPLSCTMTTMDAVYVFFDIDNTLYSASTKISAAMGERIHAYFVSLGLSHEEANDLHLHYYSQYGLALRGLTKHHNVDPIEFDKKCDGTLPLETMIKHDPKLVKLFQDIDRSKVRVWGLTNAYKPHATRVLRILGLEDLIEDVIYCDYAQPNFLCKPEPEFYVEAMRKAGATDPSKCLFIDDNRKNCDAAQALGWSAVHFRESGLESVEGGRVKTIGSERVDETDDNGVQVIRDLEELRTLWAQIFKTDTTSN